ncbi:hypothetical protein [Hyphococcus sp.]|uniref:hypothetical protein n=1 Tax=Hyphococcus sp. TaxID=2038636 RepID=UPI003CCBED64
MKTIRQKHLAYVFFTTLIKVALLFAVLVPVLEFSSETPFRSFEYVATTIGIVAAVAIAAGLATVAGVIFYTKIASSFEYDGTWKDLRKKVRFF